MRQRIKKPTIPQSPGIYYHCIEGIDGAGKTTVFKSIQKRNKRIDYKDPQVIPLYLSLPYHKAPSYSRIESFLQGTLSLTDEEARRLFVINFQETWEWVQSLCSESTVCRLYTDRSWISQLVYSEYPFHLSTDKELSYYIETNQLPTIEALHFCEVTKEQLIANLESRDPKAFSIYENKGVDYLMNLQKRYIIIIRRLHTLGFITTVTSFI